MKMRQLFPMTFTLTFTCWNMDPRDGLLWPRYWHILCRWSRIRCPIWIVHIFVLITRLVTIADHWWHTFGQTGSNSVWIREYNFSEVQSGKDLCDARTGTCRLHILNHINEGHNVTNTSEMKEALESHGGIRKTYVTIINIDASQQPALSGPMKVPISMYNKYIFLEEGLQIFKAYGIGGELIPRADLDRISRNMLQQDAADVSYISSVIPVPFSLCVVAVTLSL